MLPVQREPATPAAGGGYFHNGNYQPADLLLTCNGLLMTCTKCKVGSSFTQRPGTDEPAKPCISTLSAVGTQLTLAPNFHLWVASGCQNSASWQHYVRTQAGRRLYYVLPARRRRGREYTLNGVNGQPLNGLNGVNEDQAGGWTTQTQRLTQRTPTHREG